MSDALDQGITVTELQAIDDPVSVAAQTTAAFVGRALRGPLNTPTLVKSFAQFTHRFGGEWGRSGLGPAVRQFFEHGGRELYIVRVANGARGAMICLPADHGVLVLTALEPGSTESIRAAVDYDGCADSEFNLTLQRLAPSTGLVVDQEIYRRVTCTEAAGRYVVEELGKSNLVRVSVPTPPGRPVATASGTASGNGYVGHAQRGHDGDALTDYDLIGSAETLGGLFALESVDRFDLLYLAVGYRESDVGPAAILAAELYARKRGAMLILDPSSSWTSIPEARAGMQNSGYSSANMVSYFPRMRLKSDPSGTPRPIGGAVAGLLCKLDWSRGCWEDLDQPGFGLSRSLVPAVGVDADGAVALVREGLNVITAGNAGRARVCGSVTLARANEIDRRFESLTVRRLCLQITNTVERATRWAVFEAGGSGVADRVRRQVRNYLHDLADRGAFVTERFDVECESAIGPQRDVTVMLSFQPQGSEELICLSIHQGVQGARVAITAFAPSKVECA